MVQLVSHLKHAWRMIQKWQEEKLHPKSSRSSVDSSLGPARTPSPAPAPGGGAGAGAAKARCPAPVAAVARLRVEKIEGGLVVAGFVVAANCQIVLPIFGFLFMLVGCVLTAASYRGPGADELPVHYAARIAFTGNSRVLGPVCIVTGAIMTIAGVILCLLTRIAQRKQRRLAFHCPLHGDFYPISPVTSVKGGKRGFCGWWRGGDSLADAGGAQLDAGAHGGVAPRCPRSRLPSTRAEPTSATATAAESVNSLVATCPAPLPFLVPSDSVAGMGSVLGAPLSPEQTFGSIRSLTVSREVASFPLSRTPSPPPSCDQQNVPDKPSESPLRFKDDSSSLQSRPNLEYGSPLNEFHALECRMTSTHQLRNSISSTARAANHNPFRDATSIGGDSVSILVPDEGKG